MELRDARIVLTGFQDFWEDMSMRRWFVKDFDFRIDKHHRMVG